MLRRRHQDAAIRSSYLAYRTCILAGLVLATPLLWLLAPDDLVALLPFLAPALLLRFAFLDAGLDRQGMQHWSMLVQNGWMLPLSLAAILTGRIEAEMAGHAALWSSLILAGTHLRFVPEARRWPQRTEIRPALAEILHLTFAQGLGQLYGRAVLFGLGAGFTGPLASLAIYAKQAFNAAGLLVTYLRRVELARRESNMRMSLFGQAAIALLASLLVAFAAARLNVPIGTVLALVAWQGLEKLAGNAVYAFQLGGWHAPALAGLLAVTGLGLFGLATAMTQANVLVFIAAEALGYCAILVLWLMRGRLHGLEVPP